MLRNLGLPFISLAFIFAVARSSRLNTKLDFIMFFYFDAANVFLVFFMVVSKMFQM